MATPKQSDPQFKLRLPSDLKWRLEAEAEINNRSLSAEIIARLESSFMGRGKVLLDAADTAAALRQSLQERIERLDKMALEQEVEIKKLRDERKRLRDAEQAERDRRAAELAEYRLQQIKNRPADEERERRNEEYNKKWLDDRLVKMRADLAQRSKQLDEAIARADQREAQLVESIRKLSEIQKRR